MPSFIIIGYVWHILGRGPFWPPPIREQPRKSPSWIGLNVSWVYVHQSLFFFVILSTFFCLLFFLLLLFLFFIVAVLHPFRVKSWTTILRSYVTHMGEVTSVFTKRYIWVCGVENPRFWFYVIYEWSLTLV